LSTALHTLQALESISLDPGGVSVASVARSLGLSLSSAYSLVHSLESAKFVEQSPAGRGLYVLGPKVPDLLDRYAASLRRPERIAPFLEDLRDRTSARAYVAMWKVGDLEVVETLGRRGSRELRDVSPGFRGAAHALALGKVYLADLPEQSWPAYARAPLLPARTRYTLPSRAHLRHNLEAVRRRRLAFDIEEYAEGVCCIAAPLRDLNGELMASIGISVSARRFRRDLRPLTSALRSSASAASSELGSIVGRRP
jgi:IclR family transcriptional regulator, acetate operon repressor